MKKIFLSASLVLLGIGIASAQTISVTVDANSGNKRISPYMYAFNGYSSGVRYNSDDFQSRVYEAGIHMTRQNSGNNSTKYNWRRKLTSHPNWYNNVHDEDWDLIAQTMQKNNPDIQAMFAFQLLGRAASSKDYNFPDWDYNKAKWWEGCEKNYAGNGSSAGNYNFTEGDVSLYTEAWPPDSTVGIISHWQDDLNLDMNQFLYWNMDNEVEIWAGTHDDVIKKISDDVYEQYIENYAATVKLVRELNPDIKICGPVTASEWTWYNPRDAHPTYKGKTYCWLEYVIMRLAEEEQESGVKMIDVFDIHNYPEDSDVATMLQTHRLYWDEDYDYPGANGVKKINNTWDNSITKEMIFVRCQEWIEKYFGKNYEVTYGISEYNIKSTDAMPTALAYAGNLGEGARHGMEYFMPWDWRNGMWETVHVFSRYGKDINVSATSSNEELLSAYTSINDNRDSLTVILVNRHESGTQTVNITLNNFDCPNGSYDVYTLADLPNGEETFVSHTDNALTTSTATVADGTLSLNVPSYSITTIVLALREETEMYAVTFMVNDDVYDIQRVAKGGSATAPADPVLEGFSFIDWDVDFSNITEATTVQALMMPDMYEVTFYDWDDTKIDVQYVMYGDNAVEPDIPTHDGYLFSKWDNTFTNITQATSVKAIYVERPSSNRYEGENARVTDGDVQIRESELASNGQYLDMRSSSIAFDVVTEEEGYYVLNIEYSLSNRTQTGSGSKYQNLYINDASAPISVEFPKTGEDDPTFATIVDTIYLNRGSNVIGIAKSWGWVDIDYIEISYIEPTTTIETYYTVNFVDWDGTPLCDPQSVLEGEDAVAPEAPTRDGYTFEGWLGDYTNITSYTTIYASYSKDESGSGSAIDETSKTVKVYTIGTSIYVTQDNPVAITVYTINGQPIKHISNPDGTSSIKVETAGVYIVTVGSERFKVTVF